MSLHKSHASVNTERKAFNDAIERAASSIVERCGAEAPEIASWLSKVMRSLGVGDQAEGWALIAEAAARKVASGCGRAHPEAGASRCVRAPNGRLAQAISRMSRR